jgi:UDP-N-acetylglucosamine pyrophosphorylase
VNFISQCANDIPANFSLNMLLYMFRNLDRVKMSYGIICFNTQISYVFDSICNSKFVCAEAPSDTFFEPLKKMIRCKVPKDKISDDHIPKTTHFVIYKVIPRKQRL